MTEKQIKRIWSKVEKTKTCWNWKAGLFSNGYGSVSIKGKTYKISRIIYKLFYKKNPGKLYVLHKCDNRKCVNPDHLFLGTHKENMKDMTNKKRQSKGECSRSKLTEKKVKKIRKIFEEGKVNKQELANKFGVSRRLIFNIVNRLAWKHI